MRTSCITMARSCIVLMAAVMVLANVTISTSATPVNGFTSRVFNDRTYFLSGPSPTNITAFQERCQLKGGYLAEIDDEREYNFITTFIKEHEPRPGGWRSVLVGATDLEMTGQWRFMTSGKPVTFLRRCPDCYEPGPNKNCIYLRYDRFGSFFRMLPWVCHMKDELRRYLCEVPSLQDHMMLTITPASIIEGHTKDMAIMCKVLDPASYSLVTFLRMSKVHPEGTSTTLVELIPKVQQDDGVYVNDERIRRSHVTGNLDKRQGDLYLKVIIPRPVKEDAGEYSCYINFERNTSAFGESRITGSLHEVHDFSSVLQNKSKLQAAVDSCANSLTHASLLSNTLTSPSLQLSFSPNNVLENATSPNVNLTCNAGVLGAKVRLVTNMLISKVMANGSPDVKLVRMIPGSQQPIYLHPGDFQTRSHATGNLRVSHPVYMQVQIRRPQTADTGLYRCSMSYVGGFTSVQERLNVWSWESLLAEIGRLTLEKQRKCSTSPWP